MIVVALLALGLYLPTLYPTSDAAHAVFRVAVCLAAVRVAIPRDRLARWGLALWAVGMVASVILALDPWRAAWGSHGRNEGAWQVGHYLMLALVTAAAPRERVVRWLAVAGALQVAWVVAPAVSWVNGRFAGSTGNPLFAAPLLGLGVWAAWRAGGRWRVLVPVCALGAAATGSWAVGVAAMAAFGVWVAHRGSQRLIAAVGVIAAVGLWVVPIPDSGAIRLELGRVAAHGIAAAPWGWGAEGFPYVWDEWWRGATATGEEWHDRAHNLVLDRAIEWGIVGVAGWLAVVIAAWRRAALPERMALAAYLAFGLTTFEMMWGAAGFSCLLGFIFAEHSRRVNRRVTRPLARGVAAVALVVGALALAQSGAAARAADFPAMQAAIAMPSAVGGDLVELYLKAPQTADTLSWVEPYIELNSSHRTQQAYLAAVWNRVWCVDLRVIAPTRPDARALCAEWYEEKP